MNDPKRPILTSSAVYITSVCSLPFKKRVFHIAALWANFSQYISAPRRLKTSISARMPVLQNGGFCPESSNHGVLARSCSFDSCNLTKQHLVSSSLKSATDTCRLGTTSSPSTLNSWPEAIPTILSFAAKALISPLTVSKFHYFIYSLFQFECTSSAYVRKASSNCTFYSR